MAALAGALMLGAAALLFVLLYECNRFQPRPRILTVYIVSEVAICLVLAFASLGGALLIFRTDLTAFVQLGLEAGVLAGSLAATIALQRGLRRLRLRRQALGPTPARAAVEVPPQAGMPA